MNYLFILRKFAASMCIAESLRLENFSQCLCNHFMDPSFDEMLRVLATISRMCLIEWLRRGGNYSVVRIPRYRSATPTKAGVVRRVAKK